MMGEMPFDSSIEDPTLRISRGPLNLECKCESYEVKAENGEFGNFGFTDRWRNGRPILTNKDGRLLQHGNRNNGWLFVLNESLSEHFVIGGSQSYLSPSDEKNWYYKDRSFLFKQVPANSLNVTCIPRTQ